MNQIKIPFSRTLMAWVKQRHYRNLFKNWSLSPDRQIMFIREFEDWEKHYLPISLKDKTILDIGAGDGETALFFLFEGAKRVIAVEPNPECYEHLILNSFITNNAVIPINSIFKLEMFDNLRFDFIKMDIEGCEEIILGHKPPKPSVIEIHGLQLQEKFKEDGYRVLPNRHKESCVTYAYWDC